LHHQQVSKGFNAKHRRAIGPAYSKDTEGSMGVEIASSRAVKKAVAHLVEVIRFDP
jgi:hypothetical protein